MYIPVRPHTGKVGVGGGGAHPPLPSRRTSAMNDELNESAKEEG